MRRKAHVVMINCDESPFFKKEILTAAIAISNSGGGVILSLIHISEPTRP